MNKLKLEAGKCYKARNGEKVKIKEPSDIADFPFIGKLHTGKWTSYTNDGRFYLSGVSDLDLIAEWEEPEPPQKSILQEAEILINGDRAAAYGDAKESFENIAKGWSVIFGKEITGRQVGLSMAWLKICRENNNHKRDNLVDLAGYAALIERL